MLDPGCLDERLLGQRDGDDNVALADRLLQIVGDEDLKLRVRFLRLVHKALGVGGDDVVDPQLFEVRTHEHRGLKLRFALCARAADRQDLGALACAELHGRTACRAGALGADHRAVSDAERELGIRIVEDIEDAGTGQALLVVHRAAADPLDASHVVFTADVAGHGVDAAEDVFILGRFAPAHDAFGRCEDVALLHQDIGALAVVQHGLHVLAAEVLDLLIVQEQNAFFHCCLPLC